MHTTASESEPSHTLHTSFVLPVRLSVLWTREGTRVCLSSFSALADPVHVSMYHTSFTHGKGTAKTRAQAKPQPASDPPTQVGRTGWCGHTAAPQSNQSLQYCRVSAPVHAEYCLCCSGCIVRRCTSCDDSPCRRHPVLFKVSRWRQRHMYRARWLALWGKCGCMCCCDRPAGRYTQVRSTQTTYQCHVYCPYTILPLCLCLM